MTERTSPASPQGTDGSPETDERSIMVDVWHVPDGYQDEFIGQLVDLFEQLRELDGFLGGQILRGVDPSLFVSYATMRSAEDRDAAMLDTRLSAAVRRLGGIARPQPHAYTVARTFTPAPVQRPAS